MKPLNLSPFIIVRAGSGPKDVGRKNREEMQLAASSKQNKLLTQVVITGQSGMQSLGVDLGVAQSEAMGTQASQRLQRKRNLGFARSQLSRRFSVFVPVWRLELECTDTARTGELEARTYQDGPSTGAKPGLAGPASP
jgi:hypothetical protein